MPKPENKYDRRHLLNLAKIQKQIDAIYKEATREAAAIGASISAFDPDKPFAFKDFPLTKNRVDGLLDFLRTSVEVCIVNGIDSEWTLANNKNNELANRVFGKNVGKLTQAQYRRYYSTNEAARDAFIKRKENGLSLSDRVWKYTDEFKNEIEMGIDLGLRGGLSADEMARDLQKYLQHPDMLFRRVRDEHGILHLSKQAAQFHPGQGVYRSSYKNARRLAATEGNIAYRTSDHLRWQKMDFVVGIEIHLSNNHTCLGSDGKPHEFFDICDELQGKYPKDFKFTGWHPHCRCYATTILKTPEEMKEDTQKILDGEPTDTNSVNEVKGVPQGFKDWVKNNTSRIVKAKKIPYFMENNKEYVIGINNNSYPNTKLTKLVGHEEFYKYCHTLYGKNKRFDSLYTELLLNENRMTDIGKAMLINQIKQEAATITYKELLKIGLIDDSFVWTKNEFNEVLCVGGKLATTSGEIVKLEESIVDILVFKDKNGREFGYPIGVTESDRLFSAKTASDVIEDYPPYLKKGIKRVSFYNVKNPYDIYWEKEYKKPNFESVATDGGKISYWITPDSKSSFRGYTAHEAGHILDGNEHKLSSSKEWQNAVEADDAAFSKYLKRKYRVSKYAWTNDSEDFAECIKAYITDHEYFKQTFPNRAAFIRKMAQKLSGHSPKHP